MVTLQAEQHLTTTEGVLTNDFSIVAATVNGSGSQTANNTLVRALFKMGIPVNGKNLFPSNISGLPTWFTIRLSKDGYTARLDDYHVLAAMNPATQAEDIQKLATGGMVVYPEEWNLPRKREDISYYPMPVAQYAKESGADAALRDYVANMVYVGAITAILDIDINEIEGALNYHFNNKKKAVELNLNVVKRAVEYAREKYGVSPHFRASRLNKTDGMIMMDGNSAAALGAVFGGVTVAAWYPITPSTSMIDSLKDWASEMRVDKETGRSTCAIVQAEDELAAIGMVIGAGWMGARAMTSTSGPGISLMSEFSGLAYFAEVPAVIWDVQRMGPSTGLPTRVSQGDLLSAYHLGHGDTKHVVLLPNGMEECFEFGWRAFDLADRLQTPIFCLSDLDMGMNMWMSQQFQYPEQPMDRGKTMTFEDVKAGATFARYRDVDGDGIGYRTLPGVGPAYFTRGTGHTEMATYSERPDDWENNLRRIARKFDTARELVPQPVESHTDSATVGIISYGSSDSGVVEALDRLADHGIKAAYHRVRALPLGKHTEAFIGKYDQVFVVENNFNGQLAELIRMDFPGLATHTIPVNKCDGLPLTARWISETILSHLTPAPMHDQDSITGGAQSA